MIQCNSLALLTKGLALHLPTRQQLLHRKQKMSTMDKQDLLRMVIITTPYIDEL